MIVGAESEVGDFNNTHWLVDSNKTYSLPIHIKPNRLLTLIIIFNQNSFEFAYNQQNEVHTFNVANSEAVIFDELPTTELITNNHKEVFYTNVNKEILYPLYFRVSKQVGITSYRIIRETIPSLTIIRTAVYAMFLGVGFSLIIFGIYLKEK